MGTLSNDIREVMNLTWPMITITCFILIIFRIIYLVKNKQKFVLYHEILLLIFIIYILSLFQIVTSQDVSGVHGINVDLFHELTRYKIGTHLFYRNVVGNIVLFTPFGFFSAYYLKIEKGRYIALLTVATSLAIEVIQLKIGRAFDVDDIILNLIGGMLGYLVYWLINHIFGRFSDNVKGYLTLFLTLLALSILILILM